MSGNTFNAKLFSDGKMVAPMLPDFPDLTKCKRCNTLLWLSKLKEIETYDWIDEESSIWKKADEAEFLSIKDYYKALNEGLAENQQEELFIRRCIWWAYNDRIRKRKKQFDDENDKLKWEDNCKKLILLLDQSDSEQKIMIADIKRNLGDFEGCFAIIESITDVEYTWLKEKFFKECEKRNRRVFLLKRIN